MALEDITTVATGHTTTDTTRVEAEGVAMEEMVMTAMAMVSVYGPLNENLFNAQDVFD